MINMDSIYRYIKAENIGYFRVIEFECEKCGQWYENEDLHLAVFLHGIFFLFGKETNYAGFTCPCCSHTILMKGDREAVDFIKDGLSAFMFQGKPYFDTSLSYFSSIQHSPKKASLLKDFSIPSWESGLSHDDAESIDMQLAVYLKKNPWLAGKYLCSYLPGWGRPIGSFLSVRWFMDKDIPKLLEIENGDDNTKVFPRYVHPMSISEDIEQLCWDYHLSEAFLHATIGDMGGVPADNRNPELSAAADFLNVLMAEPPRWDFPDLVSKDYCRDHILRKFSTKALLKDFDFEEIKKFALDNAERDYTNRFLLEQYPQFIQEYIGLAGRKDVSYSSVWALRREYLTRLYNHIKKESISGSQYAFFEEPPTWTIIYNGKTYRGLRGSGFKYIHYFVKNKLKVFSPSDLQDLDLTSESDAGLQSANGENLVEQQSDEDLVIDMRTLKHLKERRTELLADIEAAEKHHDYGRGEKVNEELREIDQYLKEALDNKKAPRKFLSQSTKNMKRVAKSIERSLATLRKMDREMYRHFHSSLRPIESFNMRYNPPTDIDWRTE